PIQRRANIVEMAAIIRQPPRRGPNLPLGFGLPAEVAVVFGVLTCGLFELAVLREFLTSIGTRRLEQPIVDRGATDICRKERLSDEVCDPVDDIRREDLGIPDDCTGRCQRKSAGEDRQMPQYDALGSREEFVAPIERR